MKNRTLLILKYLWEETDENHYATIASIRRFLMENDLSGDDKTIKKAIAELQEFGTDIIENRSTQNRYFIGDRLLELPEVKILVDAVQSSKFVTQKKSRVLINKLSGLVSSYQSAALKHQLYMDKGYKSTNELILFTVDTIQTAIAQNRKIRFQYNSYCYNAQTGKKEKVAKHDGQIYSVSPYALIWSGSFYYLIGFNDGKGIIQTFRIDRMGYVSESEIPRVKPPAHFDVTEYLNYDFSMLGGERCDIRLLCEPYLLDSIVDRFGEDVPVEETEGGRLIVSATVNLSSNFYGWVFASAGKMKIIAPEKAVNGFSELLKAYCK